MNKYLATLELMQNLENKIILSQIFYQIKVDFFQNCMLQSGIFHFKLNSSWHRQIIGRIKIDIFRSEILSWSLSIGKLLLQRVDEKQLSKIPFNLQTLCFTLLLGCDPESAVLTLYISLWVGLLMIGCPWPFLLSLISHKKVGSQNSWFIQSQVRLKPVVSVPWHISRKPFTPII